MILGFSVLTSSLAAWHFDRTMSHNIVLLPFNFCLTSYIVLFDLQKKMFNYDPMADDSMRQSPPDIYIKAESTSLSKI